MPVNADVASDSLLSIIHPGNIVTGSKFNPPEQGDRFMILLSDSPPKQGDRFEILDRSFQALKPRKPRTAPEPVTLCMGAIFKPVLLFA
jgi:hypothetical protein